MKAVASFWFRYRKRIALVVFLVYLVVLTCLLLTPRPQSHLNQDFKNFIREFFFTYIDPIVHLLCFTLLGFLASLVPWRRSRWTLLALLMAYGAGTEIVQYFIPERTPEWGDLLQDALGLVAGMTAANFFLSWWRERYHPEALSDSRHGPGDEPLPRPVEQAE